MIHIKQMGDVQVKVGNALADKKRVYQIYMNTIVSVKKPLSSKIIFIRKSKCTRLCGIRGHNACKPGKW